MQFLIVRTNKEMKLEEKLSIKNKFIETTSIICDHIDYEWSSDDNTVYFIGRNPNIELYSKYNTFNIDKNNELNFINGWLKKNEEDKLLDSNNLNKEVINNNDFDGFFNIGKIQSDGEGEIFCSLISPCIYYTSDNNSFGLSNRVSTLAYVFNLKELNKKHIASQIQYQNYSLTNDTIYKNIFQIPFGTKINFSEKLVFRRTFDLFYNKELNEFYNENKTKYWDHCFKLMKSQVKAFKNLNLSDIELGISGGKDSRLLLGIYKELLESTFTNGPVYSPEVIVGRMVSDLCELTHENRYNSLENSENLLKRMPNHLFSREFEMCPWDFGYLRNYILNKVFIDGQEFIKGLPYAEEKYDEDILNEIKNYFSNNYAINRHLNEEILEENISSTKELLSNLHDKRLFPPIKRVLSRGRWVSKVTETVSENSFAVYPFLTNTANKFGYNIPISNILNQEFHHEIIKRVNPDLLEVPLYNDQFIESKIPFIKNKVPGKLNYKNSYLVLYFDFLKDFILENYDLVSDIVEKDFVYGLSKEKISNNPKLSMVIYDILQAIFLIKTSSFKNLKKEFGTDFFINPEENPENYNENCIKAYIDYNRDIINLKLENEDLKKHLDKVKLENEDLKKHLDKVKLENEDFKKYSVLIRFFQKFM